MEEKHAAVIHKISEGDMRTSSLFRLMGAWAVLGVLIGVLGCPGRNNGGALRPSTPPTFVLAWTDPLGDVHTLESPDGQTWLNERTQVGASSATGPGLNGPGIGHDGNLTWLLVWPTQVGAPPNASAGLALKVGIGGVPAGGQPGGVVWEETIRAGPVINPIAGRPSVTFGGGRWYIAYRTVGGGIEVVRSDPNSVAAWSPPTLVVLPPGTGLFSSTDPAVAYGNGTLVLAFLRGGTVFAAGSPDGMTWSAPSPIGASEPFGPGIAFRDGVFIAVLTHLASSGTLSTLRFSPVSSTDGVTWSGPLAAAGNWDQQLNVPTAAAYGNGRLVLGRRVSGSSSDVEVWVGLANSAPSPTAMTFPASPQGIRPGVSTGPYGVSVAFGSSSR
jgi:hypothetical protein